MNFSKEIMKVAKTLKGDSTRTINFSSWIEDTECKVKKDLYEKDQKKQKQYREEPPVEWEDCYDAWINKIDMNNIVDAICDEYYHEIQDSKKDKKQIRKEIEKIAINNNLNKENSYELFVSYDDEEIDEIVLKNNINKSFNEDMKKYFSGMKVAKTLKASEDFINEFVINELKMTSFLNNLSFNIEQSMKRNNIVGKILRLEERGNNYSNIILNVENIGEVDIGITYKLNKLKLRWDDKEMRETSEEFNLSDTTKDVANRIVESFI